MKSFKIKSGHFSEKPRIRNFLNFEIHKKFTLWHHVTFFSWQMWHDMTTKRGHQGSSLPKNHNLWVISYDMVARNGFFFGPDQKSGARTGPRKSGPKNPDHIIYPDRSGFLVQSGQPWLMTSYFSYQSLERLQFWKDSHWIWSDEFHWPTASSRILINWQNFCHFSQI